MCVVGRFQMMDWGPQKNLRVYTSVEPPDYNISNIRAPTALYYSLNDNLSFEMVTILTVILYLNRNYITVSTYMSMLKVANHGEVLHC